MSTLSIEINTRLFVAMLCRSARNIESNYAFRLLAQQRRARHDVELCFATYRVAIFVADVRPWYPPRFDRPAEARPGWFDPRLARRALERRYHAVALPRPQYAFVGSPTAAAIAGGLAAVRRAMIELYERDQRGRFLRDAGGEIIDVDRDHLGHGRRLLRIALPADEPYVIVEVVNSTPEPDGSHRTYMLRVPPTITTCHAAVAWTFGMTAVEYDPAEES